MNLELHRLSNGVTVVLDRWDSTTCAVRVCFRFLTPYKDSGLAHFCEHLLCAGSKRYPKGIHDDNLSGCALNAETEYYGVTFRGHMLPDYTKTVLDVFSDCMKQSVFDPDVIERERNAVLDEYFLKGNDFVRNNIIPAVSADVSISQCLLGTPESIRSFDRPRMLEFVRQNFTRDNCTIILSGRFDDDILDYINDKFAGLPAIQQRTGSIPLFPYSRCDKINVNAPSAVRTNLAAITCLDSAIVREKANHYKLCCYNALFDWLRHNMGSDLRRLIYTSSVKTYEDISKLLVIMLAECQPTRDDVIELYSALAKTCHKSLFDKTISESFLANYKNNVAFDNACLLSSAANRCGFIGSSVMRYALVPNWQKNQEHLQRLNPTDIVENTRGVFDADKMSFAIRGPELNVDLQNIWRNNFKKQL